MEGGGRFAGGKFCPQGQCKLSWYPRQVVPETPPDLSFHPARWKMAGCLTVAVSLAVLPFAGLWEGLYRAVGRPCLEPGSPSHEGTTGISSVLPSCSCSGHEGHI